MVQGCNFSVLYVAVITAIKLSQYNFNLKRIVLSRESCKSNCLLPMTPGFVIDIHYHMKDIVLHHDQSE